MSSDIVEKIPFLIAEGRQIAQRWFYRLLVEIDDFLHRTNGTSIGGEETIRHSRIYATDVFQFWGIDFLFKADLYTEFAVLRDRHKYSCSLFILSKPADSVPAGINRNCETFPFFERIRNLKDMRAFCIRRFLEFHEPRVKGYRFFSRQGNFEENRCHSILILERKYLIRKCFITHRRELFCTFKIKLFLLFEIIRNRLHSIRHFLLCC